MTEGDYCLQKRKAFFLRQWRINYRQRMFLEIEEKLELLVSQIVHEFAPEKTVWLVLVFCILCTTMDYWLNMILA